MKKINLLLLIALAVFVSCKKDEGVIDDYQKSLNTWKAFKSSVNNSYEYAVVTSSWTGYGTETVLTIKNGQVVQRSYTSKSVDGGSGAIKIIERWTEDLAQLNTHQQGAESLTLDEVYIKAKKKWLVNSKDTETYFEAKNQGMLSTAGYVENGCMDDCFTGITIGFIRKLGSN